MQIFLVTKLFNSNETPLIFTSYASAVTYLERRAAEDKVGTYLISEIKSYCKYDDDQKNPIFYTPNDTLLAKLK